MLSQEEDVQFLSSMFSHTSQYVVETEAVLAVFAQMNLTTVDSAEYSGEDVASVHIKVNLKQDKIEQETSNNMWFRLPK